MMRTVYNLLKLLRLTLVSSAPSSSRGSLLGSSVESHCGRRWLFEDDASLLSAEAERPQGSLGGVLSGLQLEASVAQLACSTGCPTFFTFTLMHTRTINSSRLLHLLFIVKVPLTAVQTLRLNLRWDCPPGRLTRHPGEKVVK